MKIKGAVDDTFDFMFIRVFVCDLFSVKAVFLSEAVSTISIFCERIT